MKRLHSTHDIQSLWQSVRPVRAEGFLVRMQKSGEVEHRVGIIVPKKYVARAVDRNLIKRRMREAVRAWLRDSDLYHHGPKYDILIVLSRRDEPHSVAEYQAHLVRAGEVYVR